MTRSSSITSILVMYLFMCHNVYGWINPGTPLNIPKSFDCASRMLVYEYGEHILSSTMPQVKPLLYDALQLQNCPNVVSPSRTSWQPPFRNKLPAASLSTSSSESSSQSPSDAMKVRFVDATKGEDTYDGSILTPWRTLAYSVKRCGGFCTIVLRGGVHYVPSTVTIETSNVTLMNFPGERATLSGGVPLSIPKDAWKPYKLVKPTWKTYNGQDGVVGRVVSRNDSQCCKYMGTFLEVEMCVNAVTNGRMNVASGYTYYTTASSTGEWAGQCFAIVDGSWHLSPIPNVISGHNMSQNTWVADLSDHHAQIDHMSGLRLNGQRMIRAKYPNGDPQLSAERFHVTNPDFGIGEYQQGWITAKTHWLPPLSPPPPTRDVIVNGNDWPGVEWPLNAVDNDTWTGMGDHGNFHIGVGGHCGATMDVTVGYWCSASPPRGSTYTSRSPSGIDYSSGILPNAPYKNATGAVVQAWRGGGRWYTWQFLVEKNLKNESVLLFSKDRGGNQGGEGSPVGAEWWIENVLEECDSANEWYFDEVTKRLYFNFNGSVGSGPRGDEQWVAPTNANILRIVADNVRVVGVELVDTRIVYLDRDIGLPSGGDWALHRTAAIVIDSASNTMIRDSYIHRIDNNGVFITGRARNTTIMNNEISWIGSTAIAIWGNTSECMNANCSVKIPFPAGPDGRSGNHPIDTNVVGNVVHEIGIYQKQSSAFFQAIGMKSIVANNVFFNGPRAGVNFNDGFGGGDILSGNVVANMVRESGDHGPFNSWNRLPYITNARTGRPSVIPADRVITKNLMFATYASQAAIDTDDGSSRYRTHDNVFIYGLLGLKSDFGGNHNDHHSNIYAYISLCTTVVAHDAGFDDVFVNNTCILKEQHGGYASDCDRPIGMSVNHNHIYNPSGSMDVCGTTLKEWVAEGHDPGTTIDTLPSDDDVISWSRKLLNF